MPPEAKPITSSMPSMAIAPIAVVERVATDGIDDDVHTLTVGLLAHPLGPTFGLRKNHVGRRASGHSQHASSRCTTAITLLAPIALAIWTAAVPTPPEAPAPAPVSPGRSAAR